MARTLLPTLREKRRYLVFEIVGRTDVSIKSVYGAIRKSFVSLYGSMGLSDAHMRLMRDAKTRGMIRVTHESLDKLRFSLAMVTEFDARPLIIRSVGVSGMIKRAEIKFMNYEVN